MTAPDLQVFMGWETVIRPRLWQDNEQAAAANLVTFQPQPFEKLLELDLPSFFGDEAGLSSGSLAITLQATIEEYEPTGGPLNSRYVVPLIARVQFGAGGVLPELECDALQACIALPSSYIRVQVGWDSWTIPGVSYSEWTDQVRLPWATRVKATLQRSFSGTYATRSYPYTWTNQSVRLPVPRYSRRWGVLAENVGVVYDPPNLGAAVQESAGAQPNVGFPLDAVSGEVLTRMIREGIGRPVHPYAQSIFLVDPGPVSAKAATLIYQLGVS